MSKLAPGIAPREIKTCIGDLDTITDIMQQIGHWMPSEDVRPDWMAFFGRAINEVIGQIEEVLGRSE